MRFPGIIIRWISFSITLVSFNVCADWSEPVQIDIECGSLPTLSYDPDGSILAFYYDADAYAMKLRKRLGGEYQFGDESTVMEYAEAVGIHYVNSDTIDLFAACGLLAYVLRSTDGGATWDNERSYAASNYDGVARRYPGYFTEENDTLRLFYTYMRNNHPIGAYPQTYQAKRVDGRWETQELVGRGRVFGVSESGSQICTGTDYHSWYSDDNGVSYAGSGEDLAPELRVGVEGFAMGDDGTLYGIITFGSPTSQIGYGANLKVSTDNGATWEAQMINAVTGFVDYLIHPKLIVEEEKMVLAWEGDYVSEYINGWYVQGYKKIYYVVSRDRGESWQAVDSVVSLPESAVIVDYNSVPRFDLAMNSGHIAVLYSICQNGEYHTYLKEADFDDLFDQTPIISFPEPTRHVPSADFNAIPYRVFSPNGRTVGYTNTSRYSAGIYITTLHKGTVTHVLKCVRF